MRKACLDMIYRAGQIRSADLFHRVGSGRRTLAQFRAEMPERFFMEGISEANIVGLAAGLALDGKIPYVNTIATFITRQLLRAGGAGSLPSQPQCPPDRKRGGLSTRRWVRLTKPSRIYPS